MKNVVVVSLSAYFQSDTVNIKTWFLHHQVVNANNFF